MHVEDDSKTKLRVAFVTGLVIIHCYVLKEIPRSICM